MFCRQIKQEPAGVSGELTHHGALFGKIHLFGETIENQLYYTKRPLCNGQIPDTPDYIKQQGYFLLVDRGECSFVEKVRNAQRDGAVAVFIADDRCLCSEDGLCEENLNQNCERMEPVMEDDGSGSDIKIPSMLLVKSDADRLRDEIVSGSVVETSISFPVPKATNGRTEYMLFMTPDDSVSHQFLDSFMEAALAFGTKAVFQPRMLLSDGTQKGCRQYDDSHVPCKGHCTNYGRYCESPATYDKSHYENKGSKAIVESMRRTCIWNIYGKVDGVGKEWWAYIELWTMQCSYSQYSASCAESIYDVAGIDKEEVEMCMENSGSFREDSRNTLMETSLSDIAKYQVKFAPTLVVNGAVVNGALTFGNAMKAICSTFEDSDRPKICGKWDACSDECSNDKTCFLWGDQQECSIYMAPLHQNKGKVFDDDYLSPDVDDTEFTTLEPSTYSETGTYFPVEKDTNDIGDQAKPMFNIKSDDIPTIQKVQVMNPPKESSPQNVPQTNDSKNSNTAVSHEFSDGQFEFLETIEIHEGSGSDLAIGLGVGFGCAFLLLFIWLMTSKQRGDDLIASGRMARRGRHSRLFRRSHRYKISRRRRYYDDYSDESSRSSRETDCFSDDDQLSDEEDYYSDRGKVRSHRDSHYYYSDHRERDRLVSSEKSKRKSRRPRLLQKLKLSKQERKIRRKINVDEFPSDYDDDSDHTPRTSVGTNIDNEGQQQDENHEQQL